MKLTVTEEDEHTLCVSQFHNGTNSTEEVVRWLKGKKAKTVAIYTKENPDCIKRFVWDGDRFIAYEFGGLGNVNKGRIPVNKAEIVVLDKYIDKVLGEGAQAVYVCCESCRQS